MGNCSKHAYEKHNGTSAFVVIDEGYLLLSELSRNTLNENLFENMYGEGLNTTSINWSNYKSYSLNQNALKETINKLKNNEILDSIVLSALATDTDYRDHFY